MAFVTLKTGLKDRSLRRYTMLRAPFVFGLDVMLMRRWKTALYKLDITTREDVRRSFFTMKSARKRERHPPFVSAEEGWSPCAASIWLKNEGLPVPAYNPILGEWSGEAPPSGPSIIVRAQEVDSGSASPAGAAVRQS